jgi:hypothetical protein
MNTQEFYPELHVGDFVMHAASPSAAESQWQLGQVRVTKTKSCDIVVYGRTGVMYLHDCLHVDDPRCSSGTDWAEAGRGVFRLTPGEIERRKMFGHKIPSIEAKLAVLERSLEKLTFQVASASPGVDAAGKRISGRMQSARP